jgi:dissimilatory sulfite reductase (desulfoviridin) alpha/beta subunit
MESAKAGSTLFNGLLKYKPWRDKFVDRFAWALKEVYNPDHVIETIDTIADMVRSEMPAEREKFGGTVQGWENTLESMKNFAKKRGANVIQQLKSAFALTDEQISMLNDAVNYN